jgi:hypothetical protein
MMTGLSVLSRGFRSRKSEKATDIRRRGAQGAANRRGVAQCLASVPETLEPRLVLATTVGLIRSTPDLVSPGYTLLGAIPSQETYLIDTDGEVVHSWTGSGGQMSSYLLPNGNLLRNTNYPSAERVFASSGVTGRIEELAWDGSTVWTFDLQNERYQLHHDAIPMPNGNVLAIAWERFSFQEAVSMGRRPRLTNPEHGREIWAEALLEIQPDYDAGVGGEIVWEWHLSDHLVQNVFRNRENFGSVRANPQLVDFNYVSRGIGADDHIADWAHFNAVAYNAETDQILVSSREFSEVWMIDHSTTTEEAAGHTGGTYGKGGDLLWRYGNPASWKAGTRANRRLFYQHDIQWIDDGLPGAGNLLVFNNGWGRQGGKSFSSVMELAPAVYGPRGYSMASYGRAAIKWNYVGTRAAPFFAPIISGAQRLPNGNTLIDQGTNGRIFEVTPARRIVWTYVNPDTGRAGNGPLTQGRRPGLFTPATSQGIPNVRTNFTFRALRYALDYSAFEGRELVASGTIELPVSGA